jgi:NhaP-type Na+/H+ or K+/H+ antiporter
MGFLGWMGLAGALLLLMALTSAYRRRLPMSTAIVYLAVGVAIGPVGVGLVRLDLTRASAWLERLTEVAVIVSLFVGGLKLRLPVTDPAWRAAFRLAGPLMLVSIAGVAIFAHLVLGLDAGLALLLGALLAPTDPVLASAVAVSEASDHDRVRYGLSGEAGLNDGLAFPFVVFGMLWMKTGGPGDWVVGWAAHRLLWAVPAGLAVGYVLGHGLGWVAIGLRHRTRDVAAPSDFLALALIALSYVLAEAIGAWGFLATFTAGVGLRRAETRVVSKRPHPEAARVAAAEAEPHPPAEDIVGANVAARDLEQPAIAAGTLVGEALSFGDAVERLLEVLLVVLVGVALAVHWDLRAVALGLVLAVVVRPIGAFLLLVRTPTTRIQRGLMGWFGIRGVGSLYYLAYALNHGVEGDAAATACALTVSVVAVSIVVHGVSVQPLVGWYERVLARGASRAPSPPPPAPTGGPPIGRKRRPVPG